MIKISLLNCLFFFFTGQKFAMLEVKSTISKILRNYILKDANHEVQLTNDITLKSINGIHVSIDERTEMN